MNTHLNTIFPIAGNIAKLFGTETKNDFVEKLESLQTKKIVPTQTQFDIEENEQVDDSKIVKNFIPGATEIPLQTLIDAGFTFKAYLKDSTENCVDDKKDSGIIVISIQHEDPKRATLVDGLSFQFDQITEIEVATLNTIILDSEKPGVLGTRYNLDHLSKASSLKIRDILIEREELRRIRDEKLEEYNKNPELRERHTKKAFEKLKFKHSQLKDKSNADKSAEFTKGALQILGQVAGINNLKSFEELKNIPMFKKEIDAGGSFGELLTKFCDMASKIATPEESK